ncbi:putative disease resistance protein [Sesamum angolense]|uniref:Disease resistance protein n=1 Tax=Sesamum angolense TaxID=2727404 RepID=A0AAE1WLA0_9LAMI|nr:putative disease resistance protein [Sesamum angolense]
MAGAYAAVVSLRHVLEDILHPTWQWILLDRRQIQSLLENITSLQHFLEDYHALLTSKPEAEDGLESQMAKASYAAEDIIESFVLDQILAPSQVQVERILTCFSQDFPKVMQDVDSIEKKVMEIKEKIGVVKDQQPVNSLQPAAGFSRIVAPGSRDAMVGFDSHLHQIMERLIGQEAELQMISIVGMGGIGKTTLASNVFDHPTIVENFDIRAWVTISQEHSVREIF